VSLKHVYFLIFSTNNGADLAVAVKTLVEHYNVMAKKPTQKRFQTTTKTAQNMFLHLYWTACFIDNLVLTILCNASTLHSLNLIQQPLHIYW